MWPRNPCLKTSHKCLGTTVRPWPSGSITTLLQDSMASLSTSRSTQSNWAPWSRKTSYTWTTLVSRCLMASKMASSGRQTWPISWPTHSRTVHSWSTTIQSWLVWTISAIRRRRMTSVVGVRCSKRFRPYSQGTSSTTRKSQSMAQSTWP